LKADLVERIHNIKRRDALAVVNAVEAGGGLVISITHAPKVVT
jgi:hypothetical protein